MQPNSGQALLIVDDETHILSALRRLFYRHGYRVVTANNGSDALDHLAQGNIAVIISDMKMPHMSGAELLKEVASQWPDTIRIALTGHAELQDIIEIINDVGIFRHMSKPWDDSELVDVVNEAFAIYSFRADKKNHLLSTHRQNAELAWRNTELSQKIEENQATLEKKNSLLQNAYEDEKRLRKERADAKQLSEAKGRFLASISHEMRSPLNAIIATNTLLLQSDLKDEQRELARLAHDGGQTLLALINDILDFSKIEADKLQLEEDWFDLISLIESTAELMASQTLNKPVEVAIVVDPRTPQMLHGDEKRIRQILINLISNAVKFTNEGGIYIRVSPSNIGIEILVKDTGIGIPKEQQEKIFDDFFQAENSDSRTYGGTGLGLSICQRLTALMNGNITVTSQESTGSQFKLKLPLDTKNPIHLDTCSSDEVVYVDTSNEILFDSIHDQLSPIGCKVISIDNSNSPPTSNKKVTLIIDIKERRRSIEDYFFETKKSSHVIKRLSKYENLRIVGLIPNDSIGEVDKLKSLGYPLILRKPIRLKNLIDAVIHREQLIGRYRNQKKTSREFEYSNDKTVSTGILLVEDSPANQAVVKAILAKSHCTLDIANNGEEALDITSRRPYDIILMDLAMPIRDGISATQYIRKHNGPNQNTTIVAMTANAFAEDKQRCLDAGMNDFLSKPIEVDKFIACIQHWSKNTKCSNEVNQSTARTSRKENRDQTHRKVDLALPHDLIDEEVLHQLAADTSYESLPTIINIYIEETKNRIPKMLLSFQREKWQDLADHAHTLKSSSGSFGAISLQDTARSIELAIKEKDIKRVAQEIENIEKKAQKSIKYLENFCCLLPTKAGTS